MSHRLGSISLGLLLLQSAGLLAQQTASSGIAGVVTDSTQAAMPGATVTVTNTGTNVKRTTTSDAQGNFSVPNLQPATYEIRVEKSGFQTAVLRDFDLQIGQVARPAITLTVGGVSESVNIQSEAPL